MCVILNYPDLLRCRSVEEGDLASQLLDSSPIDNSKVLYILRNKCIGVSVEDPHSWKIIRPTSNACRYSNPIHDIEKKKIIELDKEPYVNKIRVDSIQDLEGTMRAITEFENGKSESGVFKISNIKTLMTQEHPALELTDTK